MRLVIMCLALVLGLALAAPASAQGFPPGPWRGVWTSGQETEYQAELDFTLENSGRVQGHFRWMLVRSPDHEQQTKIGMRGTEFVEGQFDINAGVLTLRGTRLDDPHRILGADEYRLVVSPNGQYIVGMTADHGSWRGRLELTRFGPS